MQLGRRGMTVGGGLQWWWSAASGAGWSYSVARCFGCGRGSRRGARAAVHGSSAAAGMVGVRAVKWRRRKKRVLHGGGWLLYSHQRRWTTAAWRWESVGGETATATPWARQGGGCHCLRVVGVVQMRSAHGSD
jgi:hypothetical protein